MTKKSCICVACGAEFKRRPSTTGRYCSRECYSRRLVAISGTTVAKTAKDLRRRRHSAKSMEECIAVHDAAKAVWERAAAAYVNASEEQLRDRQQVAAMALLLSEYRQAARLLLEAESAHAAQTAPDQGSGNLTIGFTAAAPPAKTT